MYKSYINNIVGLPAIVEGQLTTNLYSDGKFNVTDSPVEKPRNEKCSSDSFI